jgi:glyoxylase-like metal-dependent hydrolase (beta-lactamase superfamily II)
VAPLQGEVEADGWRLVALHTPGHSSDHFVFYEPVRGLVFSGDLYIARRVPVATPREDVDQLLASLRKVRDLRPTAMYCAHRGRVDRPAEALAAKIAWLEEVVDRARELAARGMSVRAIRRRVLGREGLVRWVSGGEYCKRNLIEAALRSRR